MSGTASSNTSKDQFAVLLVDDDPDLLSHLSFALRLSGLFVYSANSAKDALGILKEQQVSVIITDLNMPGMTGYEFIEAMKNDKSLGPLPVYVISGHVDEFATKRLNELGVLEVFEKPFDFGNMVSKLTKHDPATS